VTSYHRVLGPINILRPGNVYDRGKLPAVHTVWVIDGEGKEIEVDKGLIEEKEINK